MRSAMVVVAGVLMMLSSLPHGGLAWPALRGRLVEAGAEESLIGALGAGWAFGTAAMVAFGIVVVLCGLRLKRGDPSGLAVVRVIAACYLAFGIGAFFVRHMNPHFLFFIATGVLAGAPVMGHRAKPGGS